jgi:hypothetical protein
VINLSALDVGSPQCQLTRRWNYLDTLLLQTITPLVIVGALLVVLFMRFAAMRRHLATACTTGTVEYRQYKEKIRSNVGKFITLMLIITYLVLPPVAVTIAGSFMCLDVDPSRKIAPYHGQYYMFNDLATSCDSDRYCLI